MFTVRKRRVLVVSDFDARNTGVLQETESIVTGHMADLSKALSTFVSATLGKGNQKGELQIWANMTIGNLSQETQKLIEGIIQKSDAGEINSWIWSGQQKYDIKEALKQYLPQ